MSTRNRFLLYISAILYYSGLMHLLHWLHRCAGRRLLIVNYHQAAGGELRRHLLYLRKYFRLQFVDQALEELYNEPKAVGKDRRLPLAVTFDDGYLDNYTHAYALACELQVPITIFLISGYIGDGAAYWWFDHLVERSLVDEVTIDGRTYHLNRLGEQQELARLIDRQLSSQADEEARQTYLSSISDILSVPIADTAGIHEVPAPMLTWEQVQEMQESGQVAFSGHTLHHSTLAMLTEADEACEEVAACRSLLGEKLGLQPRVFAYPHGGIEHIGTNGLLAVQHAGYRWAVTTLQGANTPRTPPYLVRRISANSRFHWLLIALMTSGLWDFLSYFIWIARQIKQHQIWKMIRRPAYGLLDAKPESQI